VQLLYTVWVYGHIYVYILIYYNIQILHQSQLP
jgi:hypothetical protein